MSKKFLFPFVIIFSLLTLSACTSLDQTRTQILDKVTEISEKIDIKINQENDRTDPEINIDTLSDEQLLKELESNNDLDLEADFSSLEKELQQ
jgi:hypothetical protein